MRANIRYAFLSRWKVGCCGFFSGVLALLVPLAFCVALFSMGFHSGVSQPGMEQLLKHLFTVSHLELIQLKTPIIIYLNTAALLLLLGLLGMTAALIRGALIRRRSNRKFLSGRPRVWIEITPFAMFAIAVSLLRKDYAAIYIGEALIMFLLWSFWCSTLLEKKKKP